jgi:hypothetical protein
MKTFREFVNTPLPNKIVVPKEPDTTFRDGGSLGYYVKNKDECGFQLVVQDFSIGAKRNNTEGTWYARQPSPDHLEKHPIDMQQLQFV